MSSLLITNARIVTLDESDRFFDTGSIYVEHSKIVAVGDLDADQYEPDRTIDANNRLVMPGLIIAHHHLYSTFARGFPPPGPAAQERLSPSATRSVSPSSQTM